jgi:hypothetical protein
LPDLVQKNFTSLLRAKGMGWQVGFVQNANPAFEVAVKLKGGSIGESAIKDLPADKRLMVGASVTPDEARDFSLAFTNRCEV